MGMSKDSGLYSMLGKVSVHCVRATPSTLSMWGEMVSQQEKVQRLNPNR